jgi:nitrogen regulation protein NR(I)
MNTILIVDDEPSVLSAFQEMLSDEGYSVVTAPDAESALAAVPSHEPEVVVTDICMPGMSGLDALQTFRQRYPKLPVIVMSGRGTMVTAIEATKRGAFDYVLKPFQPEEILAIIRRAMECTRLMRGSVSLEREDPAQGEDVMVGRSPQMHEVFKTIGRVAATDATVLIRGESGTGKELVARAVYQHSLRAQRPLMVLNCAAIPETLLESELFGHERGAFTGAAARRIGKFEQAHGGTLFLDEIGDVSPAIQAKILRVLQEKELQRVGGGDTIRTDVRVLAATNRDLEKAMSEGQFRQDLYHRLNVVTIHLPPLRKRRGDIPALVSYFLKRFADELQIEKPPLTDEALAELKANAWPGNVRELQHCLHRTLIITGGRPIQATDLQLGDEQPSAESAGEAAVPADELKNLVRRFLDGYQGQRAHAELLDEAERLLLQEALRRNRGNQSQAARQLGLTRPTLHAKIHKFGLAAADD